MENEKSVKEVFEQARAAQWDECVLDVIENRCNIKASCEKYGLPAGSWYSEAAKRGMWEPGTRGERAAHDGEKLTAIPARHRSGKISKATWDKFFADINHGGTVSDLCKRYQVSFSSFKNERARRNKKRVRSVQKVAPFRSPTRLASTSADSSELIALRQRCEVLMSQNMQLIGENKAYKAILRSPTRRRK